jgi:hypothetical protein
MYLLHLYSIVWECGASRLFRKSLGHNELQKRPTITVSAGYPMPPILLLLFSLLVRRVFFDGYIDIRK